VYILFGDIGLPTLERWVLQRDDVLAEMACVRGDNAKSAVNALISCPSTHSYGLDDEDTIQTINGLFFYQRLRAEMFAAHSALKHRYSAFCDLVHNSSLRKRNDSTVMSLLCQDVESTLISIMASCIPPGLSTDIKHDQIDVKLPHDVNISQVASSMQEKIYSELGMRFRIKSASVTTSLPIEIDPTGGDYEQWKALFEQRNFVVRKADKVACVEDDLSITMRTKAALGFAFASVEANINRWIADPSRRDCVRIAFKPPPMKVEDYEANLWDYKEFAAAKLPCLDDMDDRDELLRPIMEHIGYLTGGEEACREYVLNYLAHIIQKPGEKVPTYIAIYGSQGTGKDILFGDLFAKRVLGEELAYVADKFTDIFTRFSTAWENRVFIWVTETGRKDFTDIYINLKAFTGTTTRTAEHKFETPYQTQNLCRVICSMNDTNGLSIPSNDRRTGCFIGSIMPVTRDPLYFTKLAAAVADPKVIRAFYEFFLERDITSFQPEKIVKDSAMLVTQRSFNLKTLEGGYFAIFLRTYLEYAERVWSKRDNHFNLIVSDTLSVPYAALRAAWLAFLLNSFLRRMVPSWSFKRNLIASPQCLRRSTSLVSACITSLSIKPR